MTRALDALVAERVFERNPLLGRHGMHENGDIEYHWGYPVGHDVALAYSTDWAAAFQVVERMAQIVQEKGLELQYLTLQQCGQSLWVASFGYVDELDPEWWERADDLPASASGRTAQEAIAVAALRAVGVDEAEIQRAWEVTRCMTRVGHLTETRNCVLEG